MRHQSMISILTFFLGMSCPLHAADWSEIRQASCSDFPASVAYMAEAPLKGDLDGDGKLGINDVTLLVAHILGEQELSDASIGDLNEDGKNNVADVMLLVNIILDADDGDSPRPQDDDANPEVPVLAPRK